VKEYVSRKWRNWCQNEVYEETKGADCRDKVKHNGRSDQLFLERMMVAEHVKQELSCRREKALCLCKIIHYMHCCGTVWFTIT